MTQSKFQRFTYFKSFEQADVWDESFFSLLRLHICVGWESDGSILEI